MESHYQRRVADLAEVERPSLPQCGSTRLIRQRDTWVLAVDGEHDVATVPGLEDQMERVVAHCTKLVVDLSSTTFIDSQVIGWLVRWHERTRHLDHLRLAVAIGCEGSPPKRLFDLLDLSKSIPSVATKAEAMESVVPSQDPCPEASTAP